MSRHFSILIAADGKRTYDGRLSSSYRYEQQAGTHERLAPFVRRGFETRFRFLSDAHGQLGVRGRTMQAWGRILGRACTSRPGCGRATSARRHGRRGWHRCRSCCGPTCSMAASPASFPTSGDICADGSARSPCVLATKGSYLDVAAGLGLPRNDSLSHHLNQVLRDRHEDGASLTPRWKQRGGWAISAGRSTTQQGGDPWST